jgi:hypothetical protein
MTIFTTATTSLGHIGQGFAHGQAYLDRHVDSWGIERLEHDLQKNVREHKVHMNTQNPDVKHTAVDVISPGSSSPYWPWGLGELQLAGQGAPAKGQTLSH